MEHVNSLIFLLVGLTVYANVAYALTYDVTQNGAIGDGVTDDTKAFLATWASACKDAGSPIILVPASKTFLLEEISFHGPCSSSITLQVEGGITRSSEIWPDSNSNSMSWILFQSVNGLTISGPGQIDGQGAPYWAKSCKNTSPTQGCIVAPDAFKLVNCQNVEISGLKFVNSPKMHIVIYGSTQVNLHGLNIIAPGQSSPNTDGIHIQSSQHVNVYNSFIGTGDDCVSIGTHTYDINVTEITCGPGHGISIGSLGHGNSQAQVEMIHVSNCNLSQTTNGLRIKTWQGGSGYARDITFKNINLFQVNHPILIDQYYCDKPGHSCPIQASAVHVSNVNYIGVSGTTNSKLGIELNCSSSVGCTDITLNSINIQPAVQGGIGDPILASCLGVQGVKKGTVFPDVSCLVST